MPCAVINATCSQGTEYASTLLEGQRFIDSQRLEITNPGGIYGGYSLQSIEEHYTRSLRNPVLTSLVEMSGLTENRGTGLAVAAQAMSARGLPSPKYEVVYSHFKATLFNNQAAPVTSYFNKA